MSSRGFASHTTSVILTQALAGQIGYLSRPWQTPDTATYTAFDDSLHDAMWQETPLPVETNPCVVFDRLFGSIDSTDPAVRKARLRRQGSILDSVLDKVSRLQGGSGTATVRNSMSTCSPYVTSSDASRTPSRRVWSCPSSSRLQASR